MRSYPKSGLLLLALAAAGCAAPSGGEAARAKAPTAVATTRLSAAELEEAEDAPRVGKAQRSIIVSEPVDEDVPFAKDAASSGRHVERRQGGGFSGYK